MPSSIRRRGGYEYNSQRNKSTVKRFFNSRCRILEKGCHSSSSSLDYSTLLHRRIRCRVVLVSGCLLLNKSSNISEVTSKFQVKLEWELVFRSQFPASLKCP